jgi:PAS domain S-box-containing protein
MPKINVPDLEGMLSQVASTLTTIEREVQDRDGHWYSMWIRPYRTAENRIDGAVMAFLDIDTVKRSLQELREARSFAEAIVETVRHPLLVLDANLRVRTANRSFYETFGTTPEQTRDRAIYELGAGEWNTPTIRALLEDVSMREAPLQELEQDFERAGRKTMRISARRMVGSGPGNALFLLAFEDVTQRKEAAEARYRRLFESTKDGIILVDAESGRITDANPCAIDMLGTPRAELIGRRLWQTAALDDSGTAELAFQELREHESVRYNDVNLKNLHGDTSVVDVMANVYSEAGRKVMQFNLRDVTMRKRAEETMRRSEEQLQNSVKMDAIGRLAGGVAHDFNNMLTTILGYADLLMTRMEPDNPYRGDIEEIHKSGQRAAALTRQLLAFGRRQVAQPKVVELNSVVSDVDNMLRKLLGENVELKMVLTPDLGHTRADGSQLQQVIVNLAMNARDAMPTGGKFRIETVNVDLDENRDNFYIPVRPGRYVMLAAADTGTGLTPDAREHLFEPFFTTKPKGMGTGLGLSTVYGVVKQSGGTIAVDTEEGKGTTMRLYFPRVDDPAESAVAKEVALPRRSAHERILLVEDDAAVRSLVHQILQREGYNVLVASDGHDALGILIKQNPALDLLLTDVVMPGMSGRELADRVKETRPGLKVLFMSGHTEDAIVKQGVIDRGLDLLPKPFAPDVLTRKVREVLGD